MGYNRPSMLKASLEYLLTTNAKVYVALDIPRPDDLRNVALSSECIEIVNAHSSGIAGIRISDVNQGCFMGVTQAITWGFSLEPELIILEDDIQVTEAFLSFATSMLDEYRDNVKVGSIAGTNLVPTSSISKSEKDIRFSAFTSSWGWATWQNRWADYLQDLPAFPEFTHGFPDHFWNLITTRYWDQVFLETLRGKFDAWDYRWLYSNWKHSRLTVVPNENLVLNIGFGESATHTKDTVIPWWLPTRITESFACIKFPEGIDRDLIADKWMADNHYRINALNLFKYEVAMKFPAIARAYRRLRK